MAYTKFGEFVRILRIKNHEVMGDMAEKLGTSTPFLSAVENGKKNVPPAWLDKLATIYCLSEEEVCELKVASEESKTQYKINTVSSSSIQRNVAMQFARSFEDMDDETAIKILELLNKKEES